MNQNKTKEEIRKKIIEAAKIYERYLSGKTFLYVYGENFFEVEFRNGRFQHLTGIDSKLTAESFFKDAKKGRIGTGQFYFNREKGNNIKTAKKKLDCLAHLPQITNSLVCVLEGMHTLTMNYTLGVTNLKFTLGLVEDLDAEGNKKSNIFLPRTLRVKDKSIENSKNSYFIDFIFVKGIKNNVIKLRILKHRFTIGASKEALFFCFLLKKDLTIRQFRAA